MIFFNLINEPVFFLFTAGFAFLLVYLGIPSIIHIANVNQLFDCHNVIRKNHSYGISRLGGIAVSASLIITTLLFSNFLEYKTSNYLITSFILIFAVGLKDDLWGVNTSTKFFMQLFSALTIVVLADIRITDLQGIFGIHNLPYYASVIFSTVLIIFITNSFNLIDGVDGLVGMTSLLVSTSFGVFLAIMGMHGYASLAFTIAGASLAFLVFNLSPARIFMGDAGSLLLGLVAAVLAIKFVQANISTNLVQARFSSAPAIAIAILIGPIFDVLRVFFLRIINKRSPFVADVNHTHHRLLRLGFNHSQTTFILISINNFLLATVIYFREVDNAVLIGMLFCFCIFFNVCLTYSLFLKERKFYKPVSQGQLVRS